jgi:hypothetical protein
LRSLNIGVAADLEFNQITQMNEKENIPPLGADKPMLQLEKLNFPGLSSLVSSSSTSDPSSSVGSVVGVLYHHSLVEENNLLRMENATLFITKMKNNDL